MKLKNFLSMAVGSLVIANGCATGADLHVDPVGGSSGGADGTYGGAADGGSTEANGGNQTGSSEERGGSSSGGTKTGAGGTRDEVGGESEGGVSGRSTTKRTTGGAAPTGGRGAGTTTASTALSRGGTGIAAGGRVAGGGRAAGGSKATGGAVANGGRGGNRAVAGGPGTNSGSCNFTKATCDATVCTSGVQTWEQTYCKNLLTCLQTNQSCITTADPLCTKTGAFGNPTCADVNSISTATSKTAISKFVTCACGL